MDAKQKDVRVHATGLAEKCGQGFSIDVRTTAAGDMRARVKFQQEGDAAALLQMQMPAFGKTALQVMTKAGAKRWRRTT